MEDCNIEKVKKKKKKHDLDDSIKVSETEDSVHVHKKSKKHKKEKQEVIELKVIKQEEIDSSAVINNSVSSHDNGDTFHKKKKHKNREHKGETTEQPSQEAELQFNGNKKTRVSDRNAEDEPACKKLRPKKTGREHTISLALPGSIIENAQTFELKTHLAGQIARACAIFAVDEIVVFDESCSLKESAEGVVDEDATIADLCTQAENSSGLLAYLLQYAECPQYLRKYMFPFSRALGKAGMMNPLAIPSHLLQNEHCQYREGVAVEQTAAPGCCMVDVGLNTPVCVNKKLPPGVRVTVFMGTKEKVNKSEVKQLASPSDPRILRGLYWGYTVRLANGLSEALRGSRLSPDGSYDLILGTSERGQSVDEYQVPNFKHVLVVFGGVQGLEHSLRCEKKLKDQYKSPGELCSAYLNTCPKQSSRTIRTEEAILVTMSILRPKLQMGMLDKSVG